jgi:hypothetical protein
MNLFIHVRSYMSAIPECAHFKTKIDGRQAGTEVMHECEIARVREFFEVYVVSSKYCHILLLLTPSILTHLPVDVFSFNHK